MNLNNPASGKVRVDVVRARAESTARVDGFCTQASHAAVRYLTGLIINF